VNKYNLKDLSVVAIDFETYYSKTHSISSLGMQGYAKHPDTDIYLVSASIAGDGGHVSDPQSMPWEEFVGPDWTWVSHNAAFDEACYRACVDVNGDKLTDVYGMPGAWECTADMVAYLGCKRDLKTACKELLGKEVSKDTRKMMEGRRWDDLDEVEMMELVEYASLDSDLCLQLWLAYCHEWPEDERRISRLTREMCARGFQLDVDRAEACSRRLASEIYENAQDIPWHGTKDSKGKTIPTTSPKAVKEYCHIKGIDPPKSMAKTSAEFEDWLSKYGEKHPFAKALGNHRSLNRTCELVKRMESFATDEGRMSYGLKYFGAKTGRWSGDAGVNVQNFPRKAVSGVDVRSLIIPKEGHTLLQADYGQIEARVALMLAEDTAQLDMVASGVDLYESHARLTMGYDNPRPMSEVDPQGRQLAKARVLGLGFGCGPAKFVDVARILGGLEISFEEAQHVVSDYRRSSPGIVAAWKRLEAEFARSAKSPGTVEHRMPLPSGRDIVYHKPHYSGRELACTPILGQGVRKVYGGLLFENFVQATARDIFADHLLKLRDLGGFFVPVLIVHDEVLLEVPLDEVEEAHAVLQSVLETTPSWCGGLPISADVQQLSQYTK
tara:strand:+ start:207 stop:2036 length:1830 start_codon:yes stop_codon:yes gene_type:complete